MRMSNNSLCKFLTVLLLLLVSFITNAQYNKVVAKDGSGDFTTIQAAIDAAPLNLTSAYKIYIKNGKYKEIVTIPTTKPFIQLIGESVSNTIITYDNFSGRTIPGGGGTTYGTNNCASVFFYADNCAAFNISMENSTGYTGDGPQALAIYVSGNKCVFKNCRFTGGQDTIWTNGNGKLTYFRNCYVDGNTDFLFGSMITVLDSCVIFPRDRVDGSSGGYVTAPNTPAGQTYGYVFRDCIISANRGVTSYTLMRPWQNDAATPVGSKTNSKTVLLNTKMSNSITKLAWSIWDAGTDVSLITAAEYKSKSFNGALTDVSGRATWSQQLSDAAAASYYVNSNLFGTWNADSIASSINYQTPIAVSNFRGKKGASTTVFNWNIAWPMNNATFNLLRSSDNVNFTSINQQTTANDTAVNFNYSEAIPPPGATYYYVIQATKAGYTALNSTDTVAISSTPTVTVTGSLGSFVQGVGMPSTSQSYIVSGASLTNNIVITAPTGYEISSNGGTNWFNNATPIVLTQTGGTVANTTISVRLNASSAATYNGNITHTSTGAASVNLAVAGTVQTTPLTVSTVLEQWPLSLNNIDSSAIRAAGVTATIPTLKNMYVSNGTTVATVPAYSGTFGQAFSATANGDGSWTTALGGPGGNLNRGFYEEFTVTAASTHSLRVDSVVLSSSFYGTSSNTKLAVVYSKTGFTTADSTDITGGLAADGTSLTSTANGAFATPILLSNETSVTNTTYRLAFAGGTGVTLASGQTLTFRLYYSCGSSSVGRYGKLKNVFIKGLATINPTVGDYRSHQTGDWTDLNTWERWDGSTWVNPAPAYPVYNNSGAATILNGHTATVSATLANGSGYVHLVNINAGGQMVINNGASVNIANDGNLATTDLQVDGAFTLLGGLFTNGNVSVAINGSFVNSGTNMNLSNNGDTVRVGSAGIYQHNANNTTAPKVMLSQASSTFSVTGLTTAQTSLFKNTSNYGNIIWNCPSQTAYYAIRNTLDSANVKGSFTVASTGSTYISFANTSCRISLPGGYYQTGGTVNFKESGTITDTLVVGGDFSVTGGSFISNFGTGTSLLMQLTGINKNINYTQTSATNTNWNISGAYTLASNLNLPNTGFGVTVGGTLIAGVNAIAGSGDVLILPAAIISIGAATGLNGNITTTGNRTQSISANYIFNGLAAQVTGTLLPTIVNSLTINNANNVALTNAVAVVGGPLTLTSGKLLLGVNTISTSSIVGGSSSNYIVTDGTGALKINNVAVGNTAYPIGTSTTAYNPATLNNSGTLDTISVRVKNTFENAVPSATKVVNKQWTIIPQGTAVNITASFGWLVADQASAFDPAASLSVIRYNGTVWVGSSATVSGTGVLATPYLATATGFTSLGNFTIANTAALPLTLLAFNAGYDAATVRLTWNTSNEINTKNFAIERSVDGGNFLSIGTVDAKNSSGNNAYAFNDVSPLEVVAYYRLKLVDKDGLFAYSKIVTVNKWLMANFTSYPNPVTNTLNITYPKVNTNAIISVYNIDGKRLVTKQITVGSTQSNIDMSSFGNGSYLLVFDNDGTHLTTRFIKQ